MPGLLWVVHDASTSRIFDWIFWWIHLFRLPLFFLIAGLSAAQLFQSCGPRRFLLHRTKRILGPLLLCSVTILPMTFCIWAYGWLLSGRCTLEQIREVSFGKEIQSGLFGLAHLWFLEYLFLFCAIFWATQRGIDMATKGRGETRRKAGWARWLLTAPWKRLLLGVPTILILWVKPGVVLSFHNSFFPEPMRLLYYGIFFAAGIWIYRIRQELEGFARFGPTYLLLSMPVYVGMNLFLKGDLTEWPADMIRLGLAASIGLFTWLSLFGCVGVGFRFFNRPRPALRYISDASYWIYLSHLPLVGLTQICFSLISGPALLKFLGGVASVVSASLLTYHVMVRDTCIGSLLNGKRSSRQEPQIMPLIARVRLDPQL